MGGLWHFPEPKTWVLGNPKHPWFNCRAEEQLSRRSPGGLQDEQPSLARFGGSVLLDSTNIRTTGFLLTSNPVPNFPWLLVILQQQISVCETRTGSDRRLASAPPADNALFVGSLWEQPYTCLDCIRTELGEKSDYPNYSEMLNMCRIQFG